MGLLASPVADLQERFRAKVLGLGFQGQGLGLKVRLMV